MGLTGLHEVEVSSHTPSPLFRVGVLASLSGSVDQDGWGDYQAVRLKSE